MACGDLAVDVVPIKRAIAGEGRDRTRDLVEQGAALRAVVDLAWSQLRRDDPAGVDVHAEVQLTPRPARWTIVLLAQPLAWGAARFDETAGCGRCHRNRRSDRWTRSAATSPRGRRGAPGAPAPPPGGAGP